MAFINYLDRITRISPILNDKDKSLIDSLKILIANKEDFFEKWLETVFNFTASDFSSIFTIEQTQEKSIIHLISQRGAGATIPKELPSKLTELLLFAGQGDQPITYNDKEDIHFASILLSPLMKSGIVIPLAPNKKGEQIVILFNSKYKRWYEKEVFTYLQQVREVSLTILNNR